MVLTYKMKQKKNSSNRQWEEIRLAELEKEDDDQLLEYTSDENSDGQYTSQYNYFFSLCKCVYVLVIVCLYVRTHARVCVCVCVCVCV